MKTCTCKFERNNGIIPTLHHARGGKVGISIISRRYSKILRCVCVTQFNSIYKLTHVLRQNTMKTTPIHISMNEITVLFQLCTMQEGAKSE